MKMIAYLALAILLPPLPLYLVHDKGRAKVNTVMFISAVALFFVVMGPGLLMYIFTLAHSVRGVVLYALHRKAENVYS
jgi:hypothetical protein